MYSKRPWIVGRRARAFGNVLEHGHTVATVERCWRGTCNPDGVRDATAGRPVPRLGKSYVTRCESSLLRGREFTAEGWEDCCQTSGWRRHGRAWRLHIARETRGRFVRPRGQISGVAGWVGLPAGSGHAVAGAQSATGGQQARSINGAAGAWLHARKLHGAGAARRSGGDHMERPSEHCRADYMTIVMSRRPPAATKPTPTSGPSGHRHRDAAEQDQ